MVAGTCGLPRHSPDDLFRAYFPVVLRIKAPTFIMVVMNRLGEDKVSIACKTASKFRLTIRVGIQFIVDLGNCLT